jgi:hypothetical protein
MLLRVASPVHVEQKTWGTVSDTAVMRNGETKVSLPDSRCAVHHSQGAGQ